MCSLYIRILLNISCIGSISIASSLVHFASLCQSAAEIEGSEIMFKGTQAVQSNLHVGHGKKYISATTKKSGRISPTAAIIILAVMVITAVAIFSNVRKYDKHGLENVGTTKVSSIPNDLVQKNIPNSIQSPPKTQQLRSVATAEKNAIPHAPMVILSGTHNIEIDLFRNITECIES